MVTNLTCWNTFNRLGKYLFFIVILNQCLLASNQFKILTEDLPPFSYVEYKTGETKGIAVEIVKELLKRVDVSSRINMYSWNYAYNLAKTKDNHILFPTNRNTLREKSFKWVGPLFYSTSYLYQRKDSNLTINTYEDAKKVKSIALVENYAGHQLLKSKGFNNLLLTYRTKDAIKALIDRKVDLVSVGEILLPFRSKQANTNYQFFKRTNVKTVENAQYIAFSKNTPDFVIKQWQKQLDIMKEDGTYNKIFYIELFKAISHFNLMSKPEGIKFAKHYMRNIYSN